MASAVIMPKAGISVESCIITNWLKKPGDPIKKGEILFSYETDKASFECESTEEGTLLEIFFGDGDEVPVLTNVCVVGNPGEDTSALKPGGEAKADAPGFDGPAVEQAPPKAPQAGTGVHATATAGGKLKISPRARRLAEKTGVDDTLAEPTGPYGRVIERDIRRMLENGEGLMTKAVYARGTGRLTGTGIGGRTVAADLELPAGSFSVAGAATEAPAFRDEKFSGIRKAISKSMTHSLSSIPQLTHNFSFDASELLGYRTKLKRVGEKLDLPNITLNDMILYAVSRILPLYPALNAHMLDGETIRYFSDVNLGMAVDTPRGLVVPTVRMANRKSLSQISSEAKVLAEKAQNGALTPDEMTGGTFTVSNLGSLGVESFTPVINPPQTGILGVDNIVNRPVEKNGGIALHPAMGISLTYDHRAIDGAPASRFASELCKALEQFPLLLAN